MPALLWILLGAVVASGCDSITDLPLPAAPTPAPAVTRSLAIQGPSRLKVSEFAQFNASFVDAQGAKTEPVLTTWSSASSEVLQIDRLTGAATAKRPGQTEVTVAAETLTQRMVVVVDPMLKLEIDDLPDEIDVGESGEVELILVADFGDGEIGIPLSRIGPVTGASDSVQWSTPQPSIVSVNRSVPDTIAIVRGLAPGDAVVRVAVAGLTAEARTKVVAPFVPVIQVPTTPNPPPTPPTTVTPQSLNGSFGFDLRRGAADCGLGLRDSLSGTLDVDGVPASGVGGRARLDYGTAYNWAQLVVTSGGADILDFESEAIAAPVAGFQVFLSGRMVVQDRSGTLRFIWVRIGQPRSDSCAVFEGPTRRP